MDASDPLLVEIAAADDCDWLSDISFDLSVEAKHHEAAQDRYRSICAEVPVVKSDDVYLVGSEAPPGVYRFTGYVASLDAADRIIANAVFNNGEGVFVLTEEAAKFEVDGFAFPVLHQFNPFANSEGSYLVGVDLLAGNHRITATDGDLAYWARLDENLAIVENALSDSSLVVQVEPTDWALRFVGAIEPADQSLADKYLAAYLSAIYRLNADHAEAFIDARDASSLSDLAFQLSAAAFEYQAGIARLYAPPDVNELHQSLTRTSQAQAELTERLDYAVASGNESQIETATTYYADETSAMSAELAASNAETSPLAAAILASQGQLRFTYLAEAIRFDVNFAETESSSQARAELLVLVAQLVHAPQSEPDTERLAELFA